MVVLIFTEGDEVSGTATLLTTLDDGWCIIESHHIKSPHIAHAHGFARDVYMTFPQDEQDTLPWGCGYCKLPVPDEVTGFLDLCRWAQEV